MSVEHTRAVFQKAMRSFGLPDGGKIAVAVSGGADSTALCGLTREYTRQNGGEMLALVVDHGLRAVSREQALTTVERWKSRGVECRLLTWTGEKPATGVERAAREARYRLLADACRAAGVETLLLGHHRQDQAETYLIRLERHSKSAGLAGMSAVRKTGFGRILRPLLGIAPADLREYNRRAGLDWVEDETNLSADFARGRLRRTLTAAEIDAAFEQTLRYGALRYAQEEKAARFIGGNVEQNEKGYLLFSRDAFEKTDAETGVFLLGDFLRFVANGVYAPRTDSLESLNGRLRSPDFRGASLGGCLIAPAAKGRVIVWREERDLPPPVTAAAGVTRFSWDRFTFDFDAPFDFPVTAAPLGRRLRIGNVFGKRAFSVLPAIFDKQGLFIAPHLGYKRTNATCRVAFTPRNSLCEAARWTCPVT